MTDSLTRTGHALASAIDTAFRIKQLEAERADYRTALEACVREMERSLTWDRRATWHSALRGAKRLLAAAEESEEGK